MECVEGYCFNKSGIEEITLPSTLKEIHDDAFKNCNNLKTIWIEEGCTPDVRKYVGNSVDIVPADLKAAGDLLLGLRRQKNAVIPDGVQKIGKRWFKDA